MVVGEKKSVDATNNDDLTKDKTNSSAVVLKTKRHQRSRKTDTSKMLRYPAIQRASLKGGVIRLSGQVYEMVFEDTKRFITKIVHSCLLYKGADKKTITLDHVMFACKKHGIKLFNQNQICDH